MVNITLSIPEELRKVMGKHSDIKWSEVARRAIEKKILEIEMENSILKKSKISEESINEISKKIKREVFEEFNKK